MSDEHDEEHVYLSTSCHHREHLYCQSSTGLAGSKTPASCKFCGVKCICMCHVAARDLDLTDKDALHAWMGARRDTGKTYPATIEEFATMQRTRLLAFLTKDDAEDDQPDPAADQ